MGAVLEFVLIISLALNRFAHLLPCSKQNLVALEDCLRPLNESWQETLRQKPQLRLLSFSAVHLDPDDMRHMICPKYAETESKCGTLLNECSKDNTLAKWAKQNFGQACRAGSDYEANGACLWTTASNQQQCLLLLRKAEQDALSNDKRFECRQVFQFYKCVEKAVQHTCKTKGVAALVHLIENYGCDTVEADLEDARNSERQCQPEDETSIEACFHPLLQLWDDTLRRDQLGLLSRANFPLYYFKTADVNRMCDLVEVLKDECPPIRQCPSHRLPQFTNSLLGVACGSKQQQFFASYECLRETLSVDAAHCAQLIPGIWEPNSGKHKEVCLRLPQYFTCVKEHIAARCSKNDFDIFLQTLKQYGCSIESLDVNFVPSPAAPQNFAKQNSLQAVIASQNVDNIRNNRQQPEKSVAIEIESENLAKASNSIVQQQRTIAVQVPSVETNSRKIDARVVQQLSAVGKSSIVQLAPPETDSFVRQNQIQKLQQKNVTVEKFLENCDAAKQKAVRSCLEPLFTKWSEIHRQRNLGNLTFALYHYEKSDLLDLCDLYASAFLICPFGQFQGCLRDKAVFAANSLLGYVCSPQNVVTFMTHHPCLSKIIKENESKCPMNDDRSSDFSNLATRCAHIRRFFACNLDAVERICGEESADSFQESVRQSGCSLLKR